MSVNKIYEVQEALGASITGTMKGTGLPLADFAAYAKTDFSGLSPVGVITYAGAQPVRMTTKHDRHVYFYDVSFLTLRRDPDLPGIGRGKGTALDPHVVQGPFHSLNVL